MWLFRWLSGEGPSLFVLFLRILRVGRLIPGRAMDQAALQ